MKLHEILIPKPMTVAKEQLKFQKSFAYDNYFVVDILTFKNK